MQRIKEFMMTSLLGGLVVILPVAILAAVFKWAFDLVIRVIQPLTHLVIARARLQETVAALVAIAIILTTCFLVGVFVRTRLGSYMYGTLENRLLKIAPGYSLVKETVMQLLGNKESPFSEVALVQPFGSGAKVFAFITDRHEDGSFTVFVPTAPNPTSGNIFILGGQYVHPVDVPVEEAVRAIISCGAGSKKMVSALQHNSGGNS